MRDGDERPGAPVTDGPAIRLQAAAEQARRLERALAPDLAAFEAGLDQLATDLTKAAGILAGEALIGFDRPANVYIASHADAFTGTRAVLRALIRARPWERHIVLLTDAGDPAPAEEAVHEAGGFAIAPDPSLGLYDRWLWLANKLHAYAAQRVVVLADFHDVVARLGARQVAPRLGARLYVVHADDRQCCRPGSTLSPATHLALSARLRRHLRDADPDLRVGTLFVPFEAERPVGRLSIPPAPIRGPGRRAAVRWSLQSARWAAAAVRARARHLATEGPWAEPVWRVRLARARLRRRSGEFVTATAGPEAAFQTTGPLGFGTVIAEVLRATGGRHLHVGAAGPDFRRHAREALTAAGLDASRLVFLGDMPLISAFVSQRIDLLLGSFPRAAAGQAAAAAGTGLPFARYAEAPVTEATGGEALTWSTPQDLAAALRPFLAEGAAGPGLHPHRRHAADPARLGRHFGRIVDAIEGRLASAPDSDRRAALIARLFDADHYREQRPDAPAGAEAALAHYLETGAAAGASACRLFDPAHYLASLPDRARAAASTDPLAHYLHVGERRGHPPHPMFDPVLCATDIARGPARVASGMDTASVLGRYLAGGWGLRPHTFFDPGHLAGQSPGGSHDRAPLIDFLSEGIARAAEPHPLVEASSLSPERAEDFAADLMAWLRGDLPEARQPHPLFDSGRFTGSDPARRLGRAAPNLLWAHVIEGNIARRTPHLLISPARVEEMRPGTLTDAVTVLELIARNRLGRADAHPLVSTAHIVSQVPWLGQTGRHPLRYFLERGAADNIDPHPWFSTHFYLYQNPDVARAGVNPLVHYLRNGSTEGRWPNAFFNGNQYFRRYLAAEGGGQPLIDYVKRGAGLFWTAVLQDTDLRRVSLPSVKAHFNLEVRVEASIAAGAPQPAAGTPAPSGAAPLLRQVLHHPSSADHPTLVTESRRFSDRTPEPGPDLLFSRQIEPGARVTVHRPSIVSPRHISAPSGACEVPAIDVGVYPDATVVAGNDGFLTASGIWLDHGLSGFDPSAMEPKGNAAVFAVSGDRVLLRRHREGPGLPSGIFCCGSYSRNYYHFLIETLPRALFAAEVAPPGTPILTDNDMPDQHYQALRLMLPGNPILRLERHRSYPVERLYAASQPNVFHDAFLKPQVSADAVRVHPATVRRFAELARTLHPPGAEEAQDGTTPRRLFLVRRSRWRQLLNSDALQHELAGRGFAAVDFGRMSFAEQIRHMVNAEAVVGQSSAHFANIVFARPGTQVFPLFSNAPGTNFNLWATLAAPLGVETINVAGWRVPGSTGGQAPEAHEHFSVPTHLVTAFFPAPLVTSDAARVLDALRAAGDEADALTSAWALFAQPTPSAFEARLLELRRQAVAAVQRAPDAELTRLLAHPLFSDPWTTLKSGLRALTDHDEAEAAAVAEIEAAFRRLAAGEAGGEPMALRRLMLLAQLLVPAWRLPMIATPEALPADVLPAYLRWLATPPFLFRPGEDEGYVDFCARLLDWIDRQLAEDRPPALRKAVARMAGELDLSQLLLIEAPLREVFAARNRVLERIAVREGRARPTPRPADGSEGRRRVGVLFRTFDKGPDSEAVVAIFRAFDRSRFEVFGYSIGFQDRVATADSDFDRDLDAAIEHRRLVSGDPAELRRQLLADDLDVLVFANATTYGLKAMELALYHRVAPVQVVTNSHLPLPLGFASFDAYLTGLSDHADHDVAQDDYPERLLRLPGPVISYLTSLKPRPQPPLGRADLGLAADELVVMNAGSLQKLRHDCLATMMRAVRDLPRGVLLLAPYNPGWAGRSQAFAFNRQLAETAAEVGLDPSRIRLLSEMTVAETEAALSCADIYLNPFPHGGATMTHLALIYGVPPVTLRRRSTRSIDQFLIGSLGFPELLADEPEDYVALVRMLAADPDYRASLSQAVRQAARKAPFVDDPAYSRNIEAALSDLLSAARSRQSTPA